MEASKRRQPASPTRTLPAARSARACLRGRRPRVKKCHPERCWRRRCNRRAPATVTTPRAPRTGAATASHRRRSSSGRAAPTGCTTAWYTGVQIGRNRQRQLGPLSASLPDEALTLLRRSGLAAAAETPPARALSGGVSSDIWRVELARGPVCVKRALPRLRVAQVWEAPVERNRYERL